MSDWVVHCWALDIPDGESVSVHPTLEKAIEAALAYSEADRYQVPQLLSLYTIAELRYDD